MANTKIKSFFRKYYLILIIVGLLILGLKFGGYLGVISTYNITTANCPEVVNGLLKCTTNTTVPYDNTTLKIAGKIDPITTGGGIYGFKAGCSYKTEPCISILNEWCTNYTTLSKNCGITFITLSSPNVSEPKYTFSSTTTKICTEGAKKCITGTSYQICEGGGTEWSVPFTCSGGQLCSNGECISKPQTCNEEALNSYQCSGNNIRQQEYRGTDCVSKIWKDIETCEEKCSDGVCVNVAPQTTLTKDSTEYDVNQAADLQKQTDKEAEIIATETECFKNSDCPTSTACDVNYTGLCDEGTCKTQDIKEDCGFDIMKFDVRPFFNKYGLMLGIAITAIGIVGALLYVRKKGGSLK